MAAAWYHQIAGQPSGPVDSGELRRLAEAGIVRPDTLVRKGASGRWERAKHVPGLSPRSTPAPSPSLGATPPGPPPVPSPTVPPPPPATYAAPQQTEASPIVDAPGPKGVGGWLLFFCVSLTILSPLYGLSEISRNWEQAQPAFAQFPSLKTAVMWENAGVIALVIYGLVVGCMIWSGNPNGREIAKKFLLIRLFGFIGVEFIAVVLMGGMPSEVVASVIGAAIGAVFVNLIWFLIWWFYFKKSKRVRNTYAKSLTPVPESGAPSRGVSGESPIRHGLGAAAVNEASEKPERIGPVTWAAIIVGSGTVLLLLWAMVFRGGSEPQQSAEKDQPPLAAAQSAAVEPFVSRAAAPAAKPKSAPASTDLTGTQVYEEVVGSTVTIHSFHGDAPIGHGSGFILYPGKVIVTNEHVIRGASRLVVRHHGGATGEVTAVRNVDANRDIAVLPFSFPKADRLDSHGLVLAPNFPKVGETVYAIGAPQGLEFTFTKGIVSQVRQGFLSFGTVIQTDVSVSPGSSGGPLVNGAGQVVGINTLASKSSAEAHNLNFAVAMSEIGRVSRSSVPQALTDLAGYRAYARAQQAATKQQQLAIQKELEQKKREEEAKKKQREEEARRAYERRQEEERIAKAAVIKQWRGVRKGLTREQVRRLLGEPTRIKGGTLETWEYPRLGYVLFHNEKYYIPSVDRLQRNRWVVYSWSEPH